jgi:hypothetical protein
MPGEGRQRKSPTMSTATLTDNGNEGSGEEEHTRYDLYEFLHKHVAKF